MLNSASGQQSLTPREKRFSAESADMPDRGRAVLGVLAELCGDCFHLRGQNNRKRANFLHGSARSHASRIRNFWPAVVFPHLAQGRRKLADRAPQEDV